MRVVLRHLLMVGLIWWAMTQQAHANTWLLATGLNEGQIKIARNPGQDHVIVMWVTTDNPTITLDKAGWQKFVAAFQAMKTAPTTMRTVVADVHAPRGSLMIRVQVVGQRSVSILLMDGNALQAAQDFFWADIPKLEQTLKQVWN